MATLLDLPNELLLEIAKIVRARGRYHNTDLACLALTCRRLRPIAQEVLFCNPSIQLTNIHKLIARFSEVDGVMLRKIRRLEIRSPSEDRLPLEQEYAEALRRRAERNRSRYHGGGLPNEVVYPKMPLPESWIEDSNNLYPKIREGIKAAAEVKVSDLGPLYLSPMWQKAFKEDCVQSLLATLLGCLNLKELYLGAAWLMDFPMFSTAKVAGVYPGPRSWGSSHHWWLRRTMHRLADQLEALEFPADFMHMDFISYPVTSELFVLSGFKRLRYLSVPMEVLQWNKPLLTRVALPGDPAVLPASLELLRVSECTPFIGNFVNELCLWKKNGHFRRLRRIELFFWEPERRLRLAQWGLYPRVTTELPRMCANAGLELFVCFPFEGYTLETPKMGMTPWQMIRNGLEDGRGAMEFLVPTQRYQWDIDGDVVMTDPSRE
ncbi:hypothetical protein M011DRAFT_467144 [Sporormia fimetaria CBS 119925]|uniref:F-box domain-containing protein n=1 Tax=Sporormia fimetaria CBS 119925 TaxID=1340428 RepID=A0A6A6VBT4_9PLEO|nr:hypothetical protein M011DRAFT_467144 [Sporormia fimetaria CBS 119925]